MIHNPKISHTKAPKRLIASLLITVGLLALTGCNSASSSNLTSSEHNGALIGEANASPVTSEPASNPYQTAGITNAKAFDDMFIVVQAAVAHNDKETVASNILYPLRVNGTGSAIKIRNKQELLEQYDSIFTAPVKEALAKQTINSLFVNYQGVMVGNGAIWFGGDNASPQKLGIIAVNHDI